MSRSTWWTLRRDAWKVWPLGCTTGVMAGLPPWIRQWPWVLSTQKSCWCHWAHDFVQRFIVAVDLSQRHVKLTLKQDFFVKQKVSGTGQTSISVQNFSHIRSTVSEMRLTKTGTMTDRHKNSKLNIPYYYHGEIKSGVFANKNCIVSPVRRICAFSWRNAQHCPLISQIKFKIS